MSRLSRAAAVTFAVACLALSAGCASKIGDECSNNTDCSPDGDRVCDTSHSGGYCTVEGCDRGTCPDEATCVRFFPVSFLPAVTAGNDCRESQMSSPCGVDAFCLTSTGQCALRSVERRFCMRSCRTDSECRAGQVCRSTGQARDSLPGAEAIPQNDDSIEDVRFCVFAPESE